MVLYDDYPTDAPDSVELRRERSVRECRCPVCGGRRDVYGLDPEACERTEECEEAARE
jgi:hypothetical protein